MSEKDSQRFELAKEGLRRLLASGATNKKEAMQLVRRIRRIAASGDMFAMETMKIWPDDDKEARPCSDFFVNERIDLLTHEAETFRTDIRNQEKRIRRTVFYALKKPIPFAPPPPSPDALYEEDPGYMETQKYCAMVLLVMITICCSLAVVTVSVQNRRTH